MNHTLKRIILFIAGVGLGLSLLTGTASAAPKADKPGKGPKVEATVEAEVEAADGAEDSSAPDHSSKDQDCNGTHHSDTGNGANDPGPHAYSNTCDEDVASGNGVGDGEATGLPCAGCVGNADDKNPQGQAPDAQHDGNNGYECDRKGEEDGGNNGIAFGNPAHTGCLESEEQPPVNETPNVPETPNPVTPVVPASVLSTDVTPASTATEVLGVSFETPAAEVVGTSFELANAAPASLARTGAPVEPSGLLVSALVLIAFGTVLTASGRSKGVRRNYC